MKRQWLMAAVLCACVLPLSAQQPTFSTRRETVRVDVLVTDRGRPVRGLRAQDFELLDSGVPQQVEFVRDEQLPLAVVLALDGSVSISPEALEHLRDGGRAVLGNLTSADSGGTALIDACYTAMTVLDRDPGRGLLIVFTDGVDATSFLPAANVLQAARRSNIVVYAVSTAPLPKRSFLRDLSEVTGGGAIEIQSTANVSAAFVRILDEFRQRYVIAFSPADVPGPGWHPLTVRVKARRVDVNARAGYAR
jgi:hypothetical protein